MAYHLQSQIPERFSGLIAHLFGVGGVATGTGKGTYNRPFSTINAALDACTANRGDIILIMPGYTETIATAAGGTNFDVAGVAIVGLGSGSLKPTLTYNGVVGADSNLSSDDVTLYNLRFVANLANITAPLHITGADARVDNCEFLTDTNTACFLTSILSTNTAFGLQITNCVVNMESTIGGVAVTDVAAQAFSIDGDNTVIKDNVIHGEFSVTMILNTTTAIEGLIVTDNVGANVSTAAAAGAVSLAASSTGMIYRNNFGVLESSSIDGLIINRNCGMIENYFVNVEAETGGVVGTISS
jgi:hypothetical protein